MGKLRTDETLIMFAASLFKIFFFSCGLSKHQHLNTQNDSIICYLYSCETVWHATTEHVQE